MAIFLGFLIGFIPVVLYHVLLLNNHPYTLWILILIPVLAIAYLFFPFEKFGIGHRTIQGASTDPIIFTASLAFFAFFSYYAMDKNLSCKLLQSQYDLIEQLQHDYFAINQRYIQNREELEGFSNVIIHKKIAIQFNVVDDTDVSLEVSHPQCDAEKFNMPDLLVWSSSENRR